MAHIAVLSATVADQIAAGEVVERPASVVKELVENALDAGATTVDIVVEDGGRALIRVADDGCGMERDDALLAVERHATSKITSAEQLVGVLSFGFRGEALPAIASVSQLEIETSHEDGAGVRVSVAGGALRDVTEISRRRGTTVSVSRLFYNTPARLRFMKGARAEWRGILETMHAIGALRRDVHFTLRHDGRVALDLPAAPSLRARLVALWGHQELGRFIDVDDVHGPVHVTGVVERPADVGTGSRRVLLVVNRRVIRDHGLVRAAEAAYRSTIPAGVRPALVLNIHLPGDGVDVNVHPAKAEVRFHDRWPIERAVEGSVRRALGVMDASAGIGWRTFTPTQTRPDWQRGHTALEPDSLRSATTPSPFFGVSPTSDDASVELRDENVAVGRDGATSGDGPGMYTDREINTATTHRGDATEPVVVPPLVQLRRTYLMFEHADGVILIDQHSAHERVLYERFLGDLESGRSTSQRLLFPMMLHLSPHEIEAFELHRRAFETLGFEIEGFGGATLAVHAVPMPHPRFDAERCLRETLASLVGDRAASDAKRHERLASTVACKAAIKAGDVLSTGEMRALFIALADTRLPAHDVHGRSTIVRVSWDELDRRFGRK